METQVGVYFKKISEKLERRANCEGDKRDITFSQGKVLWYLHKHEGEDVTMRDIEKFFDCSHATVSGIVSRLVEKGYVAVETDKNDRRAKNVRTTGKGKRLLPRYEDAASENGGYSSARFFRRGKKSVYFLFGPRLRESRIGGNDADFIFLRRARMRPYFEKHFWRI